MRPWLQKARDAFRRQTAPVPTPFEIVCPCGRTLVGVRVAQSQRLLCPACRERLYILPLDRYPVPPPKAPKFPVAKAPAKSQPEPAAVAAPESLRLRPDEIELVDEGEQIPEAEVVEEGRAPRRSGPRKPGPPPRVHGRSPPPPAPDKEPPKEPEEPLLRRPRRKIVTPVRVVLAVIVGVVVLTAYVGVRRSRLDRAEVDLRVAVQQADEALQDGRFGEAAGVLDAAVAALDVLGRDDPFARGVRQDHREATALSEPAEVALLDAVEAAVGAPQAPSPPRGWFLFDATIRRIAGGGPESEDDSETPGGLEVEFPCTVRDGPVTIEIAGDADPALVPAEVGHGERRIFAAEIESILPPGAHRPRWTIRLRGATAFAWCRGARLEAAGLTPDESDAPGTKAWHKVLDEQSRRAGIGS